MEATLLTLKFDLHRGGFPKEELEDFCLGKVIHQIQPQFFSREDEVFWSIFILYDRTTAKPSPVKSLDKEGAKAFESLRNWRKERAQKEGFPPYLIATDKQFVEMIRRRVRSKSAMLGIKGFGKKRIEKYGPDIIHILANSLIDEKN